MQRRKNIRLMVLLVISIASIFAIELAGSESPELGIDRKLFQLDSQQEITNVDLNSSTDSNHFKYVDGRWRLNDSLYLDQSMRDVFFSVLSQVEVRRPVAKVEIDSVAQLIEENGTTVIVRFGNEIILNYKVVGNKKEELTWMMKEDGIPYQVHLPGYQSYVAGIFTVPTEDWRSRFILNINFAMVQKIELDYPGENRKLDLEFKNNFFEIPNVVTDSTKIANFLEDLAYLQADKFLKKGDDGSRYDSLTLSKTAYSTLTLTMIGGLRETIEFYDLEDDHFLLVRLVDGSRCLIDRKRAAKIFKTSNDFD